MIDNDDVSQERAESSDNIPCICRQLLGGDSGLVHWCCVIGALLLRWRAVRNLRRARCGSSECANGFSQR